MTTLTPERIAQLHTEGAAQAQRSRFVDPHACAKVEDILHGRGETWAASVLLRDLARRSLTRKDLPWITEGEMYTLILADRAEWELLENSVK